MKRPRQKVQLGRPDHDEFAQQRPRSCSATPELGDLRDLTAVADAGVMPPKSTWFEPQLADGMVSYVLD
jgi:hypothetical protein